MQSKVTDDDFKSLDELFDEYRIVKRQTDLIRKHHAEIKAAFGASFNAYVTACNVENAAWAKVEKARDGGAK